MLKKLLSTCSYFDSSLVRDSVLKWWMRLVASALYMLLCRPDWKGTNHVSDFDASLVRKSDWTKIQENCLKLRNMILPFFFGYITPSKSVVYCFQMHYTILRTLIWKNESNAELPGHKHGFAYLMVHYCLQKMCYIAFVRI